jgi:hypothetical protein
MAAKEGLKVALKEELRAGVNCHMLAIKCSFKDNIYTAATYIVTLNQKD